MSDYCVNCDCMSDFCGGCGVNVGWVGVGGDCMSCYCFCFDQIMVVVCMTLRDYRCG
jgi:hypothetical protein